MANNYNASLQQPPGGQWSRAAAPHGWWAFARRAPFTSFVLVACVLLELPYLVNPAFNNALGVAAGVAFFEPWRLITSAFAHFGPVHLVMNMWMLMLIGPPLERSLGTWRFAWLYLFSALGGSVLVEAMQLWGVSSPSLAAGASGALFGLFGSLVVLYKRTNSSLYSVLVILAINLVYTFIYPGISWEGHLGGLVAGAVFALVLKGTPLPGAPIELWSRARRYQVPVALLLTAALLVFHWAIYQPYL